MTVLLLGNMFLWFSFMLVMVSQPLTLGLVIMWLTLLACMMAGLLVSPWYAYILFLVYLGGLLVAFAYVSALIPNMLFSGESFFMMVFVYVGISTMMLSFDYLGGYFSLFSDLSVIEGTHMKMMKYFGHELAGWGEVSVLVGLAGVLLMALVAVVKICFNRGAAMREFK
uniref:NADH dehydrogenase subunit 6 n=1 Tax=Eualetes tulipa TaxID=765164 RepID=E2FLT8_9CAEN|nr:NADH dehydrogenase subunit 6 [Eualetes tulipa]ADI79404.1 NADH dehydrogenase subunit 6 [Eualetes tulipa]